METKQQQKKGLSLKNVHDKAMPSEKKADNEIKDGKKKGDQQEGTSKNKRKDVAVANVAAAKRQKEVSESDAYAPAAGLEKGKTAAVKLVENTAEAPSPMHMQISVNKAEYEGLKKLFSKNKKAFKKRRPQILVALWSSRDSRQLSLKFFGELEGVDKFCVCNCAGYACILLLECLSEVIADPVLGVDFPVVPSDVKEIVRSMARRCKSLLDNRRCDDFPIASQVFLQLLATFGIGTDFSADDILDFVVAMSRRGIGAALCRRLGLTEKIPVVVDRLIEGGKQIDAIVYASAFGLLDRYDPGGLIKSFIVNSQNALEAEKAKCVKGNMCTPYNNRLIELKHAMKALKVHKLDLLLPAAEDLRHHVAHLKKDRFEIQSTRRIRNSESTHDKAPQELESGRRNGAINRNGEAGTRPGFDSAHEMHGGSGFSSLHYVPTDLGHPKRANHTPTETGHLTSCSLDRPNRRPEHADGSYKASQELESGRPNGAIIKNDEAGTRPGMDSAHEMHGGSYFSSLGHYVPTGLGHSSRVDYTPTEVGRPLFASYSLDRFNGRPESTYGSYGLGGRSPGSLYNSNAYRLQDSIGSYPSGPLSAPQGFNTYSGMPRNDTRMLSDNSASHRRLESGSYGLGGRSPGSLYNSNPYGLQDLIGSYPSGPLSAPQGFNTYSGMPRNDTRMLSDNSVSHGRLESGGPSSNYQRGSGLPPSSAYLPYYLR